LQKLTAVRLNFYSYSICIQVIFMLSFLFSETCITLFSSSTDRELFCLQALKFTTNGLPNTLDTN